MHELLVAGHALTRRSWLHTPLDLPHGQIHIVVVALYDLSLELRVFEMLRRLIEVWQFTLLVEGVDEILLLLQLETLFLELLVFDLAESVCRSEIRFIDRFTKDFRAQLQRTQLQAVVLVVEEYFLQVAVKL